MVIVVSPHIKQTAAHQTVHALARTVGGAHVQQEQTQVMLQHVIAIRVISMTLSTRDIAPIGEHTSLPVSAG